MQERKLQVFLVDDEEAIVSWLAKNIDWGNFGCEVAGFAMSGEAALTFISQNQVDVLLTDIQMPGMSGLELIRQAKERKPDLYVIVLSAYDKFAYVKETFRYGIIDYCLKPIDVKEINNCLKTVELAYKEEQLSSKKQDINIFRNSIFQRLLSGDDDSTRMQEQCRLADINLEVPVCRLAMTDLFRIENERCSEILALFNAMESEQMHVFLDGHMHMVLLLFGEEAAVEADLRQVYHMLVAEDVLRDTVFVVGRPLQSYREIGENYGLCRDFSMAGCLFGGRVIDTWKYSYEKYRMVIKGGSRQQFLNQLQSGNREKIMQAVRQAADSCPNEEARQKELTCLMVFALKHLSVLQPLNVVELPEGIFANLNSSKKMLAWMEQFFWNMANSGSEPGSGIYHQHVNKALTEMRKCYTDSDFSIQDVAKSCHVSPAYLGKIFREQTGESFNDYLLKVRMLEAEKFLYENELRIGDVAGRVGFSNQSYFNKMFRKVYGISPREYRYRCQEEV